MKSRITFITIGVSDLDITFAQASNPEMARKATDGEALHLDSKRRTSFKKHRQ